MQKWDLPFSSEISSHMQPFEWTLLIFMPCLPLQSGFQIDEAELQKHFMMYSEEIYPVKNENLLIGPDNDGERLMDELECRENGVGLSVIGIKSGW